MCSNPARILTHSARGGLFTAPPPLAATDAAQTDDPRTVPPPPSSRRDGLWGELERLHAQLGIDPPTATYPLEALEADVALARRAAQQPAVPGRAQFDRLPCDAPPEGGDHRSRTTWRTFSAPLFVGERPPPEPYGRTSSEDHAGTSDTDTQRGAGAACPR